MIVIELLQALWRLREGITASLLADGYSYKYDVSLPLCDYYNVVEVMRQRLGSLTTRVAGFGHIGDGQYSIYVVESVACDKIVS